jgi:hypothetical protein
MGEAAGKAGGVALVKDRFLNTLSAATARGAWVIGVRGAAGNDVVTQELSRLGDAVSGLTAPAAAPPQEKGDDDGEH